MAAAIETTRAVLIAAAPVIALVPATRITPLIRPQTLSIPAITLQRVSSVPSNGLRGYAGLDDNLVQLDVYSDSYATSRSVADACRTALQTAGHIMNSEIDLYESEVDPELYRLTQTWQIWTT